MTSPEPLVSLGTIFPASVLKAMKAPSALGNARKDSSSPPLVDEPGMWLTRWSVECGRSKKKISPLPEALWPESRSLALLVNETVVPSPEICAPKLLAFALAETTDVALRDISMLVLVVRSQMKTASTLLRSLVTRSGAVLW